MDPFFALFIRLFQQRFIRLINSHFDGRAALRIRPGATAIVGNLIGLRLRGGDFATRGVSARDSGRIDTWLRSEGMARLAERAAMEAWAETNRRTPPKMTTISIGTGPGTVRPTRRIRRR